MTIYIITVEGYEIDRKPLTTEEVKKLNNAAGISIRKETASE